MTRPPWVRAEWLSWVEAFKHISEIEGAHDLCLAGLEPKLCDGLIPAIDRRAGGIGCHCETIELTKEFFQEAFAALHKKALADAIIAAGAKARNQATANSAPASFEVLLFGDDPLVSHHIFLQREAVFECWPASTQTVDTLTKNGGESEQLAGGRKRGPKVKFDWDRLFAEVLRHVYDEGLPENDMDYANKLMVWCTNNFKTEHTPEFETIRSKLRIWFSSLRQRPN